MYQNLILIRFPKNIIMKKILFASIVLFVAFSGKAQFIKVGAMAGANAVKISGQSFNNEFNVGYWAGAFVEMGLGNNWFIKPELQFSESQLRNTTDFKSIYKNLLNSDTLSHINLQYLSIPITLNYKIANILALNAGAQYGIQLDKHKTILKNGQDAFSNGDLSLIAGATIMLGKFRVSARYLIGLNNINDIDSQDKWKSQSLQAGIGFVL